MKTLGVLTIVLITGIMIAVVAATFATPPEETKIAAMILSAKSYNYRIQVAFNYAFAMIETNRQDFYDKPENVVAMEHSIVVELHRAMLCEDAPEFVKEQLPYTVWWSTNTPTPGVPWRWASGRDKDGNVVHGPGIDFTKVPERSIP